MLTFNRVKQTNESSSGFTLLEISISITLIAISVAAIMAGASLIKQAELRSVISDVSSIQSHISSFGLYYKALPGDMDDASNKLDNISYVTANGNADGRITYNQTNGEDNESLRAWQHLFMAGLVPVEYSGENVNQNAVLNDNIALSQIEEGSAGYYFDYSSWLGSDDANLIVLGKEDGDKMNDAAVLSPNDARSIDAKMDDGNPASGLVLANTGSDVTDGCVTLSGAIYSYNSDDSDILECIQAFVVLESN